MRLSEAKRVGSDEKELRNSFLLLPSLRAVQQICWLLTRALSPALRNSAASCAVRSASDKSLLSLSNMKDIDERGGGRYVMFLMLHAPVS